LVLGNPQLSRFFVKRNIPFFCADIVAHDALKPNSPIYKKIIKLFSKEIVRVNGELDRKIIADRVFTDPVLRKQLEKLIHPFVMNKFLLFKKKNKGLLFADIPLLYEAKWQHLVDFVLVITSSKKNQLSRLKVSRGWSNKEVLRRIASQMPIKSKMAKADDVIFNNADKETLYKKIDFWLIKQKKRLTVPIAHV